MSLYKCVECSAEIADDAYRCPKCGTADAGYRAKKIYSSLEDQKKLKELEDFLDKTNPGWRQLNEKKANLEKSLNEAKKLSKFATPIFISLWFLIFGVGAILAKASWFITTLIFLMAACAIGAFFNSCSKCHQIKKELKDLDTK
jgi:ribosomal protein L40E